MSEKSARKKSGKKSSKRKESVSSSPKSKKSSRAESPKERDHTPRGPPQPPVGVPSNNKEFKFYCEAREELISEDSLNAPPYAGMPHKIVTIEEAYRYRLAAIYNVLNTHLFSKKEQLLAQMHRVEYRLEEVKRVKLLIERDMKSEFSAMNERLNAACGARVAILEHDIAELNADLDRINHVISAVDNSSHDMIGFLQRSVELRDALEVSVTKPFRTDIEVSPDELPRELASIRDMVQNFSAMQALVAFKDELIWKLLHEQAGEGEVDENSQKELAEWARLTDKFAQELDKYQLNCIYCGCPLNEETVNSPCPKNTGYSIEPRQGGLPGQGNSRHHFVKVKEAPKVPLERTEPAPLRPSAIPERDVDSILRHLSRFAQEKGISIERIFRDVDPLNTGVMNPTDFFQILTHEFGLVGGQINSIIAKYDVSKSGRIEYPLFLRDLTCQLPEVTDKLRLKARALLDYCSRLDVYNEGTISQEMFKEALRSQGLNDDETYQVLQSVGLNTQGQVLYLNFYNRIK